MKKKLLITTKLPSLVDIKLVNSLLDGVEITYYSEGSLKITKDETLKYYNFIREYKPDGILNMFPVWFNYDKEFFNNYCNENLSIISISSTGYDLIDTEEAEKHGVYVTNSQPTSHANNTAEIAMMLIISCLRKSSEWIYTSQNPKRNSEYMKQKQTFQKIGKSVRGSSLGIIGLGKIGISLSRIAKLGFQMNVYYYKRNRLSEEEEIKIGVKYLNFEEIISSCDVISINCPLNKNTENMFTKKQFLKMKKSSYLVNTARSQIVNEKELIDAIKEGEIAGAGLDVFETLPIPDEKIKIYEELGIAFTPYIGGWEFSGAKELFMICIENIKKVLVDNENPPNCVNFQKK